MAGYYSDEELSKLGLKSFGEHVFISRKASIYTPNQISIGSNVRIDDFCVIVGHITIGDYIHIGAQSGLHATEGAHIIFEDYSGISAGVQIYASTDNYDGDFMTARPGLSSDCIMTTAKTIRLGKYSQVGTNSVVLAGGELQEGTAVGAMSLVKSKLNPWSIYVGIPCHYLKPRNKGMLKLLQSNNRRKT